MKLSLSGWDITVFVAYLLAVLVVGMIAARRGRLTKRDYFLSGDKLPWWMIGGSIVASNVSSHHLVGIMGTAYYTGFAAMWIVWGTILIGFNALLWVFLPYYLRNGFYTMPEFLQRRFGAGARLTYVVLVLITYIFVEVSAVLYLGALSLHALLNVDVMASVVVLALATGAYTIAGGLRAVVWTELLQLSVLVVGGLALSVRTFQEVGGTSAVVAASENWHMLLPADHPDFPWTMFLGGSLCISVYYNAANQFIVQRTLAAKNEWHARMGVVFAGYLDFFMPLVYVVPGLLAPILFPHLESPDLVFPMLVKNLLSTGIIGLVMAALIAAVMSHVSGAVNSCATIATIDLYLPYINKKAGDAQAVRFGRFFAGIVVLLGIFWANVLSKHNDKPVFIYLMNAYGYFTPGIATMFLLGILWKGTTHAGAMTAGLLTIPLSVGLEQAIPGMPFLNRTGIVFWICMLACAAVSFVTPAKPESELVGLIWKTDSLKLPPDQRQQYAGLRNPLYWCIIVNLAVLYFCLKYP
jgi:SSS family solute:Na+ symporter